MWLDEEWGVVKRSRLGSHMLAKHSLNQRSSTSAVLQLDQIANSCFRQLDRRDGADKSRRVRQMVDESVCRERQNDLGSRKSLENPGDESGLNARKPTLVQKEDRAACLGLPATDFGDDAVRHVFEPTVPYDDLVTVNLMTPFVQFFFEMVGVSGVDVDEVVLEVEV